MCKKSDHYAELVADCDREIILQWEPRYNGFTGNKKKNINIAKAPISSHNKEVKTINTFFLLIEFSPIPQIHIMMVISKQFPNKNYHR